MTTAIRLKKSSVTGKSPAAGDLLHGELAINFADGKLFYKNSSNEIKHFIDSDGVQTVVADYLPLGGGEVSGTLTIQTPFNDRHAATKKYVDEAVAGGAGAVPTGDYETLDAPIQYDAFGVSLYFTQYDLRNQPRGFLSIADYGVLT